MKLLTLGLDRPINAPLSFGMYDIPKFFFLSPLSVGTLGICFTALNVFIAKGNMIFIYLNILAVL